MRGLRRNALIVGVAALAALALGTMPAAAGSARAGSATATKARPVATAEAAVATTAPTSAPASARPVATAKTPTPPASPTKSSPGGPTPPEQPTSAAATVPDQPAPADPAVPPVDTAPLVLPPGVTAGTPPEPHIITNFADGLKGQRRGPAPGRVLSVPVRADVDGCDRNYGEASQCVPNVLPGGQADVCTYLAQRGITGVKVKGVDRKGIDRNRNGVVCD